MKKSYLIWFVLCLSVSCKSSSSTADIQPRDQYVGLYKGNLSSNEFKNLYTEINLTKSSNGTDGMLIEYQNQTLSGSLYSQNKLAIFPGRLTIKDTIYNLNGDGKLESGNVLSIQFTGSLLGNSSNIKKVFNFVGYK